MKITFLLTLTSIVFGHGTAFAFPHACTVVKASSFDSCLDLQVKNDVCGWPIPRPCARIEYYVPTTFLEVVSNAKESFFSDFPGAAIQLSTTTSRPPFGAEEDMGAYSFQAHALTVPFVSIPYATLTCGGTPIDKFCFSAMSEHLGQNWTTGLADKMQPKFLAWSLSPKACLLKGAASSFAGGSTPSGYPNAGLCSFDHSWMTVFPPSEQPVCTGWGIHFPRSGTVTSSDQTTASLVIASRINSLGAEVFQSVEIASDEKWSMLYPQASTCFREGENNAALRMKQVNELGRLTNGKPKNYLYVKWKKVSCKRDWPAVPAIYVGLEVAKAVCEAF